MVMALKYNLQLFKCFTVLSKLFSCLCGVQTDTCPALAAAWKREKKEHNHIVVLTEEDVCSL